jgi:hypothetical protein
MISVITTAKAAEYFIMLFLGNLSAKKPEGENIRIKGKSISAFTTVVSTISKSPSYTLKMVFCIMILCPKSVKALKKTTIK